MMIVYTLGSDSGFGIGHDGIPDDYDDETGISVILWCIIFVFLLIVTIWFYITQLMPHERTKCEIDEEDDEDERVANRLLDPKTVEKSSYGFPSCQPSTSTENAEDYEVIDGDIRIHYSNYEREASANGNKAEPKETSTTIPRRHSMEEMSLIFPGFLPIISEEEEEEYTENINSNKDENVYKSSNHEGDIIENSVNTFIEQGDLSESNNFEFEDNETLYTNTAEICVPSTHGKGKQSIGNATVELRRRNFSQENKPQANCLATYTPANANHGNDSERETAVQKHTSKANGSLKVGKASHKNPNLTHGNFISGSGDFDLENKTTRNLSNTVPDTLIIAEESTVALETIIQDANENTNAVNLTSNDIHKISACAKPSCAFENNFEKGSVFIEKSISEVIQGVGPVAARENTGRESHSNDNELVSYDCGTSSTNMADQLTHAWTFYAVTDETTDIVNGSREGGNQMDHRQQEVVDISVDSYQDETRITNDGNFTDRSLLLQGHESVNAFETDIDVDDIDLDELDDNPEGHLNCFFKRHVSVTDLDKILSSQEMLNEGAKQCKDELHKETDLDEIMQGLTEPVGKTNKQYFSELISSTPDQKTTNELEISRIALKDELPSSDNFNMDQVSNCSESVLDKTPSRSVISGEKLIKEELNVKLTSKQPNLIVNCVESVDEKAKYGNFSMRDFHADKGDEKQLEMRSHVENYLNTVDKNIELERDTTENVIVSENRPITVKTESKKDVYSYRTNSENIGVLEGKRSKKFQVDNSSNMSFVDVNHSNVKKNEMENVNVTLSKSKDGKVQEEITKAGDNNIQRSSTKEISTRKKVGLTADELNKIDLSRPVSSSHRDEIIIGKKKLRKDSGSKPFTSSTSRNTERYARTAVTIETKEPEGKNFYQNKTDNFPNKNAINLASKEVSYLQKDRDSQYHVEKRPIEQLPSIKKSVVLIPDKKQLQSVITIKDIPDTNIGLEISTNRPFEISTQKKTSTGLDKAEEIVANRSKRLESEKNNEDITCATSNERDINWDNFLVDGLALSEVNTEYNARDCVDRDIKLTPPTARKANSYGNRVQIKESFVSQTLCPREMDWEWLDRDVTLDKHTDDNDPFPSLLELAEVIQEHRKKVSPIYDVNDNVKVRGTDLDSVGDRIDVNALKKEDKMNEKDNESDNTVVSPYSSTNKGKHSINENNTAGKKLNELHVVTNKEEENSREKSASSENVFDDNDVFSNSSQPSPEPEFPVRLTKSFSELRNVELSSQSHVTPSQFGRPDRSMSQTDVFQQQESQDDVFEESDEHVFKTRITFDEVYKNRRRIVILNVRKKSPGKNRWKSLSDLDSARKHVFRFNSSGSCPEENTPAGENLSLSTTQNKEAIFAVSGSEALSTEGLHNNDATNNVTIAQSHPKQTADQIMKEMDFDFYSKLQQESKLKQSNFTTIEQSLQQDDDSSKVTSDDTSVISNSVIDVEDEIVEPKGCALEESAQSSIFQNGEKDVLTSLKDTKESEIETCLPQHLSSTGSTIQSCAASQVDSSLVNEEISSIDCLRSPTSSEVETLLSKLEALSPMEDSAKLESQAINCAENKQSSTLRSGPQIETSSTDHDASIASSNRSSGTVFAASRHSPIPLSEDCAETSLERQSSLSPTLDFTKDDSSCTSRVPSSGTMFAVSRHSPTPFTESTTDGKASEKRPSPSPVKDLTRHGSDRSSPSGTLFAISRHSPTPMKDTESEIKPEVKSPTRSTSPGTVFAVSRLSPVPLLDSEVDTVLQRQQSLSPVRDIAKPRSPSGRMFTVSRHSPIPAKDSPTENSIPRPSSLSPVQDVFQRSSSQRSSGRMFAISRHSPTPLSDAKCVDEKLSSHPQEKSDSLKKEAGISPRLNSRTSSEGRRDDVRPEHRESPEFKSNNHDSSSRRSSASSGYGGSRVSPTSSLDWRHKTSKSSPSPELGPQYHGREANSRCSSVSRISPTLSTDSECSNIDERKPSSTKHRRQGDSSRSGIVFAISGYSSAASDNESPRVDSPRENEPKYPVKPVEKDEKHRPPRERNSHLEQQHDRNTIKTSEISSYAATTTKQSPGNKETQIKTSTISRSSSSEMENDYKISEDGWLIKGDKRARTGSGQQKANGRSVVVTDLDSLLYGMNPTSVDTKTPNNQHTKTTPQGVQETDLDAIFNDSDSSSLGDDKSIKPLQSTKSSKLDTMQRSKVFVTTSTTSVNRHTVKVQSQEEVVNSTALRYEKPLLDNLDEDVFTKLSTKPVSKDYNDTSFSSDADSETSSLNSVPLKPKSKNAKMLLDAVKSMPERLSSDSSSATPSTPEKLDQELLFFHPDLTSTPENMKTVEIRTTSNYMSREVAKKPRLDVHEDKVEGSNSLTDSSIGANQVKMRSKSESQSISTGVQKSAFTPVNMRTKNRRSISQECLMDGPTADPDIPSANSAVEDHATFKELADSHKSMPDLHKAHENIEVDMSTEKMPYHSRLSAHTRLWLSQTAGIDTSNLCKDESVGSEIFLFPSKRFQPGRNVDASFLSIASETEDVPDDVSSRPSSPMSEFSFSGETPFGGKFDDDLNIIACGHHLCGQEEVIRGHEKTSFTSCPSCYTYYCSRECRQAHWREHKKSCYFGRINSYMRSFVYFCHKKENLKLLLSNIAVKNYASKGRGCVMVTFASPKQARKFMTSGCVLLPSPPSYPTVRELMREGVVSKHKVNLVHLVKDYDPTKEFVLNLAVVAGRLDDLPRHPVPRHKLNTVLECIRIPLSQSVIKPPSKTVPDTTKETRVFYLPKCSRHEFINDMEARRHYCRNISKGLKSYGIRLKKDYPDAYESLCLYVEKNVPFKPLIVYGNEGSKIITCKIMPEASISAV